MKLNNNTKTLAHAGGFCYNSIRNKVGVINMLDQYIIEISNFSETAIITTVEENDNYCKKFFDHI